MMCFAFEDKPIAAIALYSGDNSTKVITFLESFAMRETKIHVDVFPDVYIFATGNRWDKI